VGQLRLCFRVRLTGGAATATAQQAYNHATRFEVRLCCQLRSLVCGWGAVVLLLAWTVWHVVCA
jgi:hypothetical protein